MYLYNLLYVGRLNQKIQCHALKPHKMITRTIYQKKRESRHSPMNAQECDINKKSAHKTLSCPGESQGFPHNEEERERQLSSLQENQSEDISAEENLRTYIKSISKTSSDLATAARRMSERLSGMFDASQIGEDHVIFTSGNSEQIKELENSKLTDDDVEEDIDTYFKDYVEAKKTSSCCEDESVEEILNRDWKVLGTDWKVPEAFLSGVADQTGLPIKNYLRNTSSEYVQHHRLSPSRSVSMLKKLVSKKRTNFISNKSVSEDLSAEGLDGCRTVQINPVDSKNGAVSSPDVYKFENFEANYRFLAKKSTSDLSIGSDQTDLGQESKKESRSFSRLVSGIFNKVVGSGEKETDSCGVSSRKVKVKKFDIIDLSGDDTTTPVSVIGKFCSVTLSSYNLNSLTRISIYFISSQFFEMQLLLA